MIQPRKPWAAHRDGQGWAVCPPPSHTSHGWKQAQSNTSRVLTLQRAEQKLLPKHCEQNQIIKVQEKPRQALGNRFIMAHPAHWIQRGELKWLEMEEYGRKGTGISPTLPCCCFPHSLISRSCRRTTPGRTGLNHHSHFSIPKNQFITHLFLAISSETQVTLLRASNKNVTAEQKESNFNSKEVKVGINWIKTWVDTL